MAPHPLQRLHLNALNTTILHVNILHGPEALTCPQRKVPWLQLGSLPRINLDYWAAVM
jgi:hypothetical protein